MGGDFQETSIYEIMNGLSHATLISTQNIMIRQINR